MSFMEPTRHRAAHSYRRQKTGGLATGHFVYNRQQVAALYQQQYAQNGQHDRAQTAVEHIVGTGGEAAQLLTQQGGGHTGGLTVVSL